MGLNGNARMKFQNEERNYKMTTGYNLNSTNGKRRYDMKVWCYRNDKNYFLSSSKT
jgi:hypothetical protein